VIDYEIWRIPAIEAKEYIRENHYSHGISNCPAPCYGLFYGTKIIGVCAFAVPCSESVRSSVFGKEYKNHVIELHRLHILDCTPKNTESWFISRCLKLLKQDKPEIWAVISFSDLSEGHNGTIYKAANAYYLGITQSRLFFIDFTGRLRHPRQSGRNIKLSEAAERGWKPQKRKGKNRFLWILPNDKRHKRDLLRLSKYKLT
jgi:hypothetical protein